MRAQILASILLLLIYICFPVLVLAATPHSLGNVKFNSAEEFSTNFIKEHGRKPDEITIFQLFYFAKVKEAHRKGHYQKVLDDLPNLREKNQKLKDKIKNHYELTIGLFRD